MRPRSFLRSDSAGLHRFSHLSNVNLSKHSHGKVACRAVEDDKSTDAASIELTNNLSSIGIGLVWLGFVGYVLLLSPTQSPVRDQYFIEKLVGIAEPGGPEINAVFTALFNIMGIWPAIYTALLVPSGKSGNKVPAWPFLTGSFALGMFALGPYFALWSAPAPEDAPRVPPTQEDMAGWTKVGLRITESKITAGLLLAAAVALLGQAAVAGGPAWTDYFRLFDESRLVHATTLDFCLLTSFAPFWMANDAQLRNWAPRDKWLPVLSVLPVVGPALYLFLRPRST